MAAPFRSFGSGGVSTVTAVVLGPRRAFFGSASRTRRRLRQLRSAQSACLRELSVAPHLSSGSTFCVLLRALKALLPLQDALGLFFTEPYTATARSQWKTNSAVCFEYLFLMVQRYPFKLSVFS